MVKETTTAAPMSNDYAQVVPMTFEEKVNMYMRCSKLELARMLAERERLFAPVPQPYQYPWPNTAPWPTEHGYEITCSNDLHGVDSSASTVNIS